MKLKSTSLIFILLVNFIFAYSLTTPRRIESFEWGIAWINAPFANGLYSDRGYDLAVATGVTLEHRQFLWGDIEKEKERFEWFVLDHWIASLKFRKMQVSIAIGPINTLE